MISSISEYQTIVKIVIEEWGLNNATLNPWFRGHSDSSFELVPKLYREKYLMGEFEREMLRDFKLNSTQYLKLLPTDELEWMFIMQHYGLPTRLLDWSESSLIALYFAVNATNNDTDGAVWVLNPWKLNNYSFHNKTSVPVYKDKILNHYVYNDNKHITRNGKAEKPIAIRPVRNSSRIIAQKGMFVLFGNQKNSITEITNSDSFLFKIEVNKCAKENIKKELYYSGITESVIFPDMNGLCSELIYRYSNEFMLNSCNEYNNENMDNMEIMKEKSNDVNFNNIIIL